MADNAAFYAGPEIATESEARIVGSSAYARASHVMAQLSHQTYTVERLFNDCAQRGRHSLAMHTSSSVAPSSTRGALSPSRSRPGNSKHGRTTDVADLQRLAQPETFREALLLVVSELEEAAGALIPVSVPGLGVFGFRVFNMGISIPFFDMSPKFAKQHGLRPKQRARHASEKQALTQRLNLQRCSKLARMTQPLFKEVLRRMWSRLGRVMASGAVVDVDFGVGTLRCEDLAPSFDFTQRLDPTPRSSTASGSVSSGLPKRRRLPSDGKAFASSTKGGGRVEEGTSASASSTSGTAASHFLPPHTSLARIPNASRTVKVGVRRQMRPTEASGTAQFSLGRRGRGGFSTGFVSRMDANRVLTAPTPGGIEASRAGLPESLDAQAAMAANTRGVMMPQAAPLRPHPPGRDAPSGFPSGGNAQIISQGRRLVEQGQDNSWLSYGPPSSPGSVRGGTAALVVATTLKTTANAPNSATTAKETGGTGTVGHFGLSPALLDAYCRTRCATLEDVVYIRNCVDRIGSHFSPSATTLTLDSGLGKIRWRRDTKLRSAWQRKLEGKVDVSLISQTTRRKNANGLNFTVTNVSQMTTNFPNANVTKQKLHRQLRRAYEDMDNAFEQAVRANAALLEDNKEYNSRISNEASTATTGGDAADQSQEPAGQKHSTTLHELSNLGDGTEFADEQAMLVILSARKHACLVRLRMWQNLAELAGDRIDHYRYARMGIHAKTRKHIDSIGERSHTNPSSSKDSKVDLPQVIDSGSAISIAENDPDYFIFDSEGYPEHHSTAETQNIIDVTALSSSGRRALLAAHEIHDTLAGHGWDELRKEGTRRVQILKGELQNICQALQDQQKLVDEYQPNTEEKSALLSRPKLRKRILRLRLADEEMKTQEKFGRDIMSAVERVGHRMHGRARSQDSDRFEHMDNLGKIERASVDDATTRGSVIIIKNEIFHHMHSITAALISTSDVETSSNLNLPTSIDNDQPMGTTQASEKVSRRARRENKMASTALSDALIEAVQTVKNSHRAQVEQVLASGMQSVRNVVRMDLSVSSQPNNGNSAVLSGSSDVTTSEAMKRAEISSALQLVHICHQDYVTDKHGSGDSVEGGGSALDANTGVYLMSQLVGTANRGSVKIKRRHNGARRRHIAIDHESSGAEIRPETPRQATLVAHRLDHLSDAAVATVLVKATREFRRARRKKRDQRTKIGDTLQTIKSESELNDVLCVRDASEKTNIESEVSETQQKQLHESPNPRQSSRYMRYIEEGIDTSLLAPIEVRWLENAMAKLSDEVRGAGVRTQTLVEDLLTEIDRGYQFSVKKSIVDYILRSNVERKRLRINHAVPMDLFLENEGKAFSGLSSELSVMSGDSKVSASTSMTSSKDNPVLAGASKFSSFSAAMAQSDYRTVTPVVNGMDWGWGAERPVARLNESWANYVDDGRDALEENLFVTAPQMTKMLFVWFSRSCVNSTRGGRDKVSANSFGDNSPRRRNGGRNMGSTFFGSTLDESDGYDKPGAADEYDLTYADAVNMWGQVRPETESDICAGDADLIENVTVDALTSPLALWVKSRIKENKNEKRHSGNGKDENGRDSTDYHDKIDPTKFAFLNCDKRRLVSLPTSDRSAQREKWTPVEIQMFVKWQRRQMEACKTVILDDWMEEDVLSVFRETAQQGVFASVPPHVLRRFFDSLAVLMSNCTRSIVLESLKELLAFFKRYQYGAEDTACYQQAETWEQRCAIILPATIVNLPPPQEKDEETQERAGGLIMSKPNGEDAESYDTAHALPSSKDSGPVADREANIVFVTPLKDIENSILKLFDDVARSLNGVLRVEQRIRIDPSGDPNAKVEGSSIHLNAVESSEMDIQKMRNALQSVIRYNLYRPDMPSESLERYFDSYEKYRFLLRQRVELPKFFKLAIPPPLILNGPGEDEDEADMRIIRRGRIREKMQQGAHAGPADGGGESETLSTVENDNLTRTFGSAPTLVEYSRRINYFKDLASQIREEAESRLTESEMIAKPPTELDSAEGISAATTRRESTGSIVGENNISAKTKNRNRVPRGMVLVDCTQLNAQLADLATESAQSILDHVAKDLVDRASEVKDAFKKTMSILNRRSTTSQELVKSEEFLNLVDSEILDDLLRDVAEIKRRLDFLFEHSYPVTDYVLVPVGISFSWSRKIVSLLNQARRELQQDRDRLENKLKVRRATFAEEIEAFSASIEELKSKGATMEMSGAIKDVARIKREIDDLDSNEKRNIEEAENLNAEEDRLGWPVSDFTLLNESRKIFAPFRRLWRLAANYSKSQVRWRKGSVAQLDAEDVERTISEMWREVYKLGQKLEDISPAAAKLADEIKLQLNALKEHMPLLAAVCNPGLRERHWAAMTEHVGFTLGQDESMSMADLLKMGAGEASKVALLAAVSEQARKEWAIEKSLKSMREQWSSVTYLMQPYKDTGSSVLQGQGVEDIQMLLDDHIIKTQTMRSSPFAKPLAGSLRGWEDFLLFTQSLLEEWLKMQAAWLYLEPIFSSEDIKNQMPSEARKFADVDDTWRDHMRRAEESPRALDMAKRKALLDTLKNGNEVLEEIQRGLSAYLEQKRLRFPRFFFLADEELLEILAETKDPLRVQPFLKKIFDGLQTLEFATEGIGDNTDTKEKDDKASKKPKKKDGTASKKKAIDPKSLLKIVAIGSAQGERVPILKSIRPADARGAVERWLLEVESMMRLSVHDVVQRAVDDYAKKERTNWVRSWPGQAVLCVSQLYWTVEFERAVREQAHYSKQGGGGDAGTTVSGGPMLRYKEKLDGFIRDIVQMVRGNLTKLERRTMSALIIMDVHARDVVAKLCEDRVTSAQDFEWQSQLRYYWEEESNNNAIASFEDGLDQDRTKKGGVDDQEGVGSDTVHSSSAASASKALKNPDPYAGQFEFDKTLNVRMIASTLRYGFEYLGNSGRLVITPLTDRCYRTLMGAIHLQYGGAPEGPAGTGKTETTKDLSKALAQQCVVYNCSDQLDHLAMAKFFKGLASAGAWACFDEFNRITLEVLSVVAQQITTIQLAVKARKRRFTFSGTELSLKWTCNVFITMNPGYAGRSELPDNLKVLFRTVAMMVPDYSMIAEIILYSNGFLDSRSLSVKIVTTYTLCSEQLSSQSHYDYGMRAVMAVLRAAGNLKRKLGDSLSEDVLVLRAIKDVNVAKFLSHDLVLFANITSDLFPGVVLPEPDYAHMLTAIHNSLQTRGLQPHPSFVDKVVQTYEMMVVRHGFMIVGGPLAGKSQCYRVLQDALGELCRKGQMPNDLNAEHELRTDVAVINPKSITMGQLYGCFDPVSHEWSDGVLAVYYSKFASDERPARKWMVFDGPVDAIWIENMNTVLDDNKKLCLMSGEMRLMTKWMNMIFEPISLEAASPATVSRCGMVYMEPASLGWEPLLESWLASPQMKPFVRNDEASESTDEPLCDVIRQMFKWLLDPCCEFTDTTISKELSSVMPSLSREMKAKSVMNLFSSLVPVVSVIDVGDNNKGNKGNSVEQKCEGESGDNDPGPPSYALNTERVDPCDSVKTSISDVQVKDRVHWVECQFLFALVWAVGSTLTAASREKFDLFLRGLVAGECGPENAAKFRRKLGSMFPRKGSVYGFVYKKHGEGPHSKFTWVPWENQVDSRYEIEKGSKFSSIVVPTDHTVQHLYLLERLLRHKRNVLFVGSTGTGKSVYINSMLHKLGNSSSAEDAGTKYSSILLAFSAQTSANTTQDIIDSKLAKFRKGVYGPSAEQGSTAIPFHRRHAFIFVDDLNMPQKEEYGAQPPLELLRQGLADGGWYDRSDNSFRSIRNVSMVAAMVPPGGGRNSITSRLTRHFEVIGVSLMDTVCMERIFNTILEWHLEKAGFEDEIISMGKFVVRATAEVYTQCSQQLLPTPSKSHYIFNLRDYARVMQGLMMVRAGQMNKPKDLPPAGGSSSGGGVGSEKSSDSGDSIQFSSQKKMVRLWAHESLRVFSDRLVSVEDKEVCLEIIRNAASSNFSGVSGAGSLDACMSSGAGGRSRRTSVSGNAVQDGAKTTTTLKSMDGLIFCDFLRPELDPKPYDEILSIEVLRHSMQQQLDEYNIVSTKPMPLVLFDYAIHHVSRISRVIRTPGAHALLVGVGGSGRQSLTYLAGYMGQFNLKQIQISAHYGLSDFHDDLKDAMMMAAAVSGDGEDSGGVDECGGISVGEGGSPTIFLINDTQIPDETFVENLSNLLNSGEVPNMLGQEDVAAAIEAVRSAAKSDRNFMASVRGKEASPDELFAYWKRRVRANLHVVLAFSPVGDSFRKRLRQFPSLINCCTIDSFSAWPGEALVATAESLLSLEPTEDVSETAAATLSSDGEKSSDKTDEQAINTPSKSSENSKYARTSDAERIAMEGSGLPAGSALLQETVAMCLHMHESTVKYSARFLSEMRRHYHVTPTSYLEMLNTFKDLLVWKKSEVLLAKRRYEIGLEKLETTEKSVQVMQKELEALQPELVKTTKQVDEMMIVVERETADAEKIRVVVVAEEEKVNEKVLEAKTIKDGCDRDLAEAEPILAAALKALNTLNKSDITEVKSIKIPTDPVRLTMEAVCIMLGVKPARARDPENPSKVTFDYWDPAKKVLLGDPRFLQNLINFDKESIPQKVIDKVKPYLEKDAFDPKVVKTASKAAHGLCCWIRAMVKYDEVAKIVRPKREAQAKAEATLEVALKGLRKKQDELKKVMDTLSELNARLKAMQAQKKQLQDEIESCELKIDRAFKLIKGLGGEKTRWTTAAEELGKAYTRVAGDMLVSAGVVAYGGVFTAKFRKDLVEDWVNTIKRKFKSILISGQQQIDGQEFNSEDSTDTTGKDFTILDSLGDPVKIRQWNIQGLPIDTFSVENGIIVSRTRRWPLMIDPQGQANKWIRQLEGRNGLQVTKLSAPKYLRTIENGIQFGNPVLVESVGETLDPALEPLLMKQIFKKSGVPSIRLGDKILEYAESFRFYLTTNLANPHYLPEVSIKVTLTNFMITEEGLSDQLLGIVVARERPDLETAKNELIVESAENTKQLKEIEDRILRVMSSSEGNILDDSEAIETLDSSKQLSNKIKIKQQDAILTEARIDEARKVYVPVAKRSTTLFFVTRDLSNIEPMYQYSLQWFVAIYERSIDQAEKTSNVTERLLKLNDHVTYAIYQQVCRSLLEKDKLMFAFLLSTRITLGVLEDLGEMASEEKQSRATERDDGESENDSSKMYFVPGIGPVSQATRRRTVMTSSLKLEPFTMRELRFLLLGAASEVAPDMSALDPLEVELRTSTGEKCVGWLGTRGWSDICALSDLLHDPLNEDDSAEVNMKSLIASFNKNTTEWKAVFDAEDPEFTPFPDGWDKNKSKEQTLEFNRALKSSNTEGVDGTREVRDTNNLGLTRFQRLCILRCLRPDKVVPSIVRFVANTLGHKFTEPPSFDLLASFRDSNNITPIVFVLSPGTDPMSNILRLAARKDTKVSSLSLGKGQGPVAKSLVNAATVSGGWAVLQNCHLFPSWMGELAEMCQTFAQSGSSTIHNGFRLWLTSYPSKDFPVSILQNSVKLTNEPPNGIRANLMRSYGMDPISSRSFFEGSSVPTKFKKLLFALCFFHAIVQERRQFGSLGWNIPYEFTDSDLEISVRQLHSFLEEAALNANQNDSASLYNEDLAANVPFAKLRYVIGQCNYGGRVTDDKDRRLINTILACYFKPEILQDREKLSASGVYFVPNPSSRGGRGGGGVAASSSPEGSDIDEESSEFAGRNIVNSPGGAHEGFLGYIRSLPLDAAPEVFSMHPNASITKERKDTSDLFSAMMLTLASASSSSASVTGDDGGDDKTEDDTGPEAVVDAACSLILSKLPKDLDVTAREALTRFPVSYQESMNTVVVQELDRFTGLLKIIESSLVDVRKALKGLVIMNASLQEVFDQILTGKLPTLWANASYPSLKPVDAYVDDLCARVAFFKGWFDAGAPPQDFWLPGFFFTQSFLTGALQNYARKYRIPIDTLEFGFCISARVGEKQEKPSANSGTDAKEYFIVDRPEDGVIVWGLFLDGAAWKGGANGTLSDPKPKELFSTAPPIWIKPIEREAAANAAAARHEAIMMAQANGAGASEMPRQMYDCPMYKTSERRGVLSTTGQSTNFVMSVQLPCQTAPEFWTLRGTALLTQLDD